MPFSFSYVCFALLGSICSNDSFAIFFAYSFILVVIMTKGAQMDGANRAMCYALRNPGKHGVLTKFKDIQKLVADRCLSSPDFFYMFCFMGVWDFDVVVRM